MVSWNRKEYIDAMVEGVLAKEDARSLVAAIVSNARRELSPYALVSLGGESLVRTLSFGKLSLEEGVELAVESLAERHPKSVYVLEGKFPEDGTPIKDVPADAFAVWAERLLLSAKVWREVLSRDGVGANFAGSRVGVAPRDADADWFMEAGRKHGLDGFVEAAVAGVPLGDLLV